MHSEPARRLSAVFLYLLIVVGTLLSGYLLYRSLLVAGEQTGGIDICSAIGVDCDSTLKSSLATRFVIPLAGWGVVYYVALLFLLLLGAVLGRPFTAVSLFVVLLCAFVAAVVGGALLGVMVLGDTSFCVLCAVIHIINFCVPVLIVRSSGRSVRELVREAREALGLRTDGDGNRAPWIIAILMVPLLVAVITFQWVLIQTERNARASEPFDEAQFLAEFEAQPQYNVPVSEQTAVRGNREAPVTITAFSSFRCPGCAKIASLLRELLAEYPDDLRVVVKHFPLSDECNPAMTFDMQPGTCAAARAAQAAGLQGKFWEYHDALFEAEQFEEGFFQNQSEQLGLDGKRFETDMQSDAVEDHVREDVELGNRIGITGTPAVLVNGRVVPQLSERILRLLIERQRNLR